jgi:hypothetical protein
MSKYGAAYDALRPLVLEAEPFCVGYPVGIHDGERVRTTEVDHIKPVSAGGQSTRENTRGLCRSCNRRKGADERRRWWRDR